MITPEQRDWILETLGLAMFEEKGDKNIYRAFEGYLTANTTEDERHTGNPVCPRCTVDCIQNVDDDWICDCHTTEDEPK